jgi:hypothetical protein
MVANTGADAKGWWWYVGQTAAGVDALLSADNARLIDIDVDPNGNFDIVMIPATGTDSSPWTWTYGKSAAAIANAATAAGSRVFKLVPYASGANTLYAGLTINNPTAETYRVQTLLEAGYGQQGLSGGVIGFDVRQIGGSTSASLRSTAPFEPASAIKALYNLYAEFQVQIGQDALTRSFTYWYDPVNPTNKDVCPLNYADTPANATVTTLKDGLDRMMGVSDNRTTQGVDLRFGPGWVNSYARIIGMSTTLINQTLGCGMVNGGFVTTSLTDLAKVYSGVSTHELLNPSRGTSFFGRMNGGVLATTDPLATVIRQEAAKLGKSSKAASFIAKVTFRDKGGSYDVCPPSGGCNAPYVYDRSDAGILALPFKSHGAIVPRTYTYGWWVNNWVVPCTFGAACAARAQADATTRLIRGEEFRALVRAALKTW